MPDVRVVHAAAYGGPYPGSFIPMLQAARAAVQSRGWRFEVVFSPGVEGRAWYRELQVAGVEMHVPPPMGTQAASRWLRALAGEGPRRAVLHSHFATWDVPVALAALGARKAVVWHVHSELSSEHVIRARNTVRFGLLGRTVDRLLCVSPEIRDQAIRRLAPPGHTEVFPNAIDLQRFAPIDPGGRAAARVRMELPADRTVLLFFAYPWERKGGRLFLETVRELIRRGRRVLAVIVAASPPGHDEARALGLTEQVKHVAPIDDVGLLYGAADIFVAPSAAEGMPFAALEAICSGVPVVASDIPSHRHVAVGMPGCRLAARDTVAFADAIETELDSEPLQRSGRLARSRAHAHQELSLTVWADRLLGVYDGILRERCNRPRTR